MSLIAQALRPLLTPLHVVHEVEKNLFLLRAGLGIRPTSDHLELWYRRGDADAAKARLAAAGIAGLTSLLQSARAKGEKRTRRSCLQRRSSAFGRISRLSCSAGRGRKRQAHMWRRHSIKHIVQCLTSSDRRCFANRRHSSRWRASTWAETRASRISQRQRGGRSSSGGVIRWTCQSPW